MPAYPSTQFYKPTAATPYVTSYTPPVPVGPPLTLPPIPLPPSGWEGSGPGGGDAFIGPGPGPIGGGPIIGNPLDPGLGGGGGGIFNPPSNGGGVLGGVLGGLEDLLESLGFSLEDVGDFVGDLIDPNSGQTTSDKDTKARALEDVFKASGQLRDAFVNFLRNTGIALTLLNTFLNTPIPNWPVFLIDLALFWLDRGAPTVSTQPGFNEASNMLFAGIGNGGSNVPVPAGDLSLLAGTAIINPVLPATATMVYKAPKGYVTVTHPTTGQKIFVEKNLAYRSGLKKRRKKAPITASEWESMKTAVRVEKKMTRMMKNYAKTVKTVRR